MKLVTIFDGVLCVVPVLSVVLVERKFTSLFVFVPHCLLYSPKEILVTMPAAVPGRAYTSYEVYRECVFLSMDILSFLSVLASLFYGFVVVVSFVAVVVIDITDASSRSIGYYLSHLISLFCWTRGIHRNIPI